jgi:hypothetical protein
MTELVTGDMPAVVDGPYWYGVVDRPRTFHLVIGEEACGARALCGRAVMRVIAPIDQPLPLCRDCERAEARA